MKKILLFTAFLCFNFLIGQQSILLPSENIVKAFEKQYPQKKPIWSMEYGKNESDIYFAAKFKTAANTQAYAVYDSDGNFKTYKEQISSAKLPKAIQTYLDANYSVKSTSTSKSKSKSKSKAKPTAAVREAYSALDAKNKATYEVKAAKDGKNYNLIFDEEGNLIKTIQIG
ncbi:hypothetical protein SAMN05444671_4434 [Flavobacterium sp. CF108]|uniref:hypothetical protein n=1 Tax=unclassified Flavobacterium TaxID=196869 RepID=UPI0008C7C83D|nr:MULTISPECIES: hypothetical protein [unclassified Flavobacterium]SEP08649.1 hypothetical protein SAMN04487978_4450 [Flavobacterium sp. fv08]SHH96144.1 hypothetical protein SAMN05444671_4434 [Flavobacterium sp. CF108]